MTSPISRAHVHAAGKEAGIDHAHLHNWAASLGYDSINDVPAEDLDDMARRIKRDPYVMAAWFDQFTPVEFEAMGPAENADPGDSSLFTGEQWADLHRECDERIAERFRQ